LLPHRTSERDRSDHEVFSCSMRRFLEKYADACDVYFMKISSQ
jgi:hypothetical protein